MRTAPGFYLWVVIVWLAVLALSLAAMERLGLGLAATLLLHFALGFGILLPLDRARADRRRETVPMR